MTTDLRSFADIHSHSRRGPDILTSVEAGEPLTGVYGEAWYSVGIHPWSTASGVPEDRWEALEKALADPRVIAVGECGLDRNRGAAAEVQEEVFLRQASLAEAHSKPLIVHCVGRYGRLMELHRRLKPSQLWIVHGFSGKAELARQLAAEGIAVSLGARSRPEVAAAVPAAMLFRETDA